MPSDPGATRDVGDASTSMDHESGEDGADPACLPGPLEAAFRDCRATANKADCIAAGGEWGVVQLSPDPACHCPTGQDDCPCTRATDCLGRCMVHQEAVTLTDPCPTDLAYRCTANEPWTGCYCTRSETGEATVICAD